jgi:hypothetical protein
VKTKVKKSYKWPHGDKRSNRQRKRPRKIKGKAVAKIAKVFPTCQ